jgi:hypothetical protein
MPPSPPLLPSREPHSRTHVHTSTSHTCIHTHIPRLYRWADWILKDDALIRADGVNSLSRYELLEALEERGFPRYHTGGIEGMPVPEMRALLTAHLAWGRRVEEGLATSGHAEVARPAVFAGMMLAHRTYPTA